MRVNKIQQLTLAITAVLSATALAEGPVKAQWLYLTGDGAWVSRSAELRYRTTTLPLPLENLSASEFWWRADDPSLTLNWQTPDKKGWLTEFTAVQVDDWPGSWSVVRLEDEIMTLAQAGVRRPLPRAQWHRLSWVVGKNADSAFELTVTQPEAVSNAFRYAWFDKHITAEVRYSLDLQRETPRFRQQLVLHNESGYTLVGPGYSYAQSRGQGRDVMARQTTMQAEPASVGTPRAGDSSGQATLMSEEPLTLPEDSHVWLEVRTLALTDVEHQYRFSWRTGQSQTIPGRWSIRINAEDTLPDMAGPVQVAVWDREVALLESRYRPQRSNQARLELGQSDMMTLATQSLGNQEWILTVTNRNSQAAEVALDLRHRSKSHQEQTELNREVPAESELKVRVFLDDNRLTVKPQ